MWKTQRHKCYGMTIDINSYRKTKDTNSYGKIKDINYYEISRDIFWCTISNRFFKRDGTTSRLDVELMEEESLKLDMMEEDKTGTHFTEEWEQLFVNEVPKIYSPVCICKPKLNQSVLLPSSSNRASVENKNSFSH